MALSIKHPDADKLARQLARKSGLSITEAVIVALRQELRRQTGRAAHPSLGDELRAIGRRCASLPDYDTRTPEEIIGFDEFGLPE